jgi:hypothetical protein
MNKLLFLAVILLTASVQAQKAGEMRIEPYVFETNSGQKIAAEFGRILVPENHSNLALAFVRPHERRVDRAVLSGVYALLPSCHIQAAAARIEALSISYKIHLVQKRSVMA